MMANYIIKHEVKSSFFYLIGVFKVFVHSLDNLYISAFTSNYVSFGPPQLHMKANKQSNMVTDKF